MRSILTHVLPSLLLGGALGFTYGAWDSVEEPKSSSTLRDRLLNNDSDPVDYDRLAQVCRAASLVEAGRSGTTLTSTKTLGTPASLDQGPPIPGLDTDRVRESLDELMERSLDRGVWTKAAGTRARGLLKVLRPSDRVDFANLMRSARANGDLELQYGAWVPPGAG